MGSTTNNHISLTYDEVVHNKIRSLEIIEEQIANALSIIPTYQQPINTAKAFNEEFIDLCRELRCNLDFAVSNIKTFKSACSNEGSELKSAKVDQDDLLKTKWKRLGEGGSNVFEAKLGGNTVAIKVLEDFKQSKALFTEGKLLRDFRHDNIVAFRGMDILETDIPELNLQASSPFIVMEFISNNLYKYVESQRTPENSGLPIGLVWNLGRQVANGLFYLHSLKPGVSHRDLNPDKLLLDIRSMRVKLSHPIIALNQRMDSFYNARWTAPEIWEYVDEADELNEEVLDDQYHSDEVFFLRADIYSYGQVIAYLLTGESPWQGHHTASVENLRNFIEKENKVNVPEKFGGPLKQIIEACREENPEKRPTMQELIYNYFSTDSNPYQSDAESAEFFCCGFLNDTKMFVADSLVDESSEGYFKTKETPQGYPADCFVCEVEVGNKQYNGCPREENWPYEQKYKEYYAHFRQAALDKKIADNPTIALKHLVTPREDEEERQEILLKFRQSTYCHHRAMREVWMKVLDDSKRAEVVPCKSVINKTFSTSFGLHVAVLTAESPPKFIFARRANREGIATPGKFTCGAVESSSTKDYKKIDESGKKAFVDLVQTAVRGLEEKLRIELKGDDVQAISLSTVYLEYDTHEWGLCGFINLSDHRIDPSRRLTFDQLGSRFSAGPKDKFEYEELKAVDFTLPTMVEFVRENYHNFASSAKLVVVKVLQSFFGVSAVEKAFQSYKDQ
ncbi:uncharacterized protein LOC110254472 isoform X2 [Exaiptasia diaphana]|uniref:Protein kinase domain-containing protein n=1 Tax=Exaiptasia diaphana TaxID=2652724 RepID=A0A913YA57_EXADI|nr:uncharacterized protein LOC110254472 isoform X2 [Exaiptasia diaphana]